MPPNYGKFYSKLLEFSITFILYKFVKELDYYFLARMTESHQLQGRITELLIDYKKGNLEAYNELFPLVYQHLRNIAKNQISRRPAEGELRKTELIHEVYLKLIDQSQVDWKDRAHFYAAAAKAMRHILVDRFRRQNAQKRGGSSSPVLLDEKRIVIEEFPEKLLGLHELMDLLAKVDERMYTIVDLRFFAGMTIEEIAELLNVSTSTVDRDWAKARGWLYQQLVEK